LRGAQRRGNPGSRALNSCVASLALAMMVKR
jgi:hypothetical protein